MNRGRLKRLVDVLGGTLTMILLLPVFGLIAIVIKMEGRGPVLYRQERLGRKREPFQIIKFRTMKVGAERGTGPVWASEGDPRATPVGRVLRATHIDEMPQLWNVIRGQMSLVGPRPERSHFVQQFESLVPRYSERFAVRPGIAGLSQIRSGYDQSVRTVRRKVRYDRFYTRRASLLLDLWLMIRTVGHVLGAGGEPGASRRSARWRGRRRFPELFPFGARARRLAGILALQVFAAGAASSIQASPGSQPPSDGTGQPGQPGTPPAVGRAVFPWPGGAALLLESAGMESELFLLESAGMESELFLPESAGMKSELFLSGLARGEPFGHGREGEKRKRKEKKKHVWPMIPEAPVEETPEVDAPEGMLPVSEPASILLVTGGLAWLLRRRPLPPGKREYESLQ